MSIFRVARFCVVAAACLALSCERKGEVAPPPGESSAEDPGDRAAAPSLRGDTPTPAPAARAPEPVEFRPAPPEPVPEPVAAEGEVARCEDRLYFKINVPATALADAPSLPEALRCAVRSGAAFQAYFVPPRDRTTVRPRRGTDGWDRETRDEFNRLWRRERELNRETTENGRRIETLRELAADREIPEGARATLRGRIGEIEARTKEIRKELAEVRKARSGLNARAHAKMFEARKTGRAPDGAMIVGRLRSGGDVEVALPATVARRRGQGLVATLDDSRDSDSGKQWMPSWAEAREADLKSSGDEEEYVDYALRQLGCDTGRGGLRGGPRQGEGAHVYDLFTGAAAIRESMQLDRVFKSLSQSGDIPIKQVRPLDLKDHPFDEMRKGRPYKGSDLAKLCPSDAIYARVASLKDWFRLEDLFNRWGGSFLSTVSVNGRDRDTFTRYRDQLGLRDKLMARLLGSTVVGETGVVAVDPLLEEGTGLALVFTPIPGKEAAFRSLFDLQEAKLGGLAGARVDDIDVQGEKARLLTAPDGLRSYRCRLGERLVVANSPVLLERIVAASKDEPASLAAAPDYRYYRALYPLDKEETAFAYLSQDFFRKITGPGWRIARGRRLAVLALMQEVRLGWQAALAEGIESPDLDTLKERGFASLKGAPDVGIALDPASGRVSLATYGPMDLLNPVDELLPGKVTREEADLYRVFSREYSRYWRQFIDPVGVRLRLSRGEFRADTLILPLIENSIYRDLRRICDVESTGEAKPAPLPPDALGAVTFRFSPERAEIDRMMGEIAVSGWGARIPFDPKWFGETVTVGVADGDMLLTASAGASEMISGAAGGRPEEAIFIAALFSAITLPAFAAVEVRDAAAVEKYLDGVWEIAARRRPGGFIPFRVLSYRTAEVPRIRTVTMTLAVVDIRFHYAFVGDWLLVSTKPGLLKRCMAAAEKRGGESEPLNGRLVMRPRAFDKAAPSVGLAWQERIADACMANLSSLARAADAGRFDESAEFLGYRVLCPEGGAYSVKDGLPVCSLHGARGERTQSLLPPEAAPAVRLANETEEVSVSFQFTDDGLASRLRVRFAPKE